MSQQTFTRHVVAMSGILVLGRWRQEFKVLFRHELSLGPVWAACNISKGKEKGQAGIGTGQRQRQTDF